MKTLELLKGLFCTRFETVVEGSLKLSEGCGSIWQVREGVAAFKMHRIQCDLAVGDALSFIFCLRCAAR